MILWFFGRSLDWAEVGRSLQKANIALVVLAGFIICFGYLLRAFRWRTLLAPITETDLGELFATTTIGFAAVFIFGRAGEVVRPVWLPMRDKRVRPSAALVTIGVERICDMAAIVVLFAVNLLWIRAPLGREAEFTIVNRAGFLLFVAAICGFAALFLFQKFSAPIIAFIERRVLSKFPTRLSEIGSNILQHLATSLQILRNPRELALTVFWTAALWFSISLPTWLVILAFGLPLSFSDALFVMGWALVGSLVPTPGGAAGGFHAITAAALIFLNVERELATATAIVMHLVYFAPALFFGVYYFLRGDVSLSRIRSLIIGDKDERNEKDEKLKTERGGYNDLPSTSN
ncbi:MAG: flippase-like domain-containing protein [Pyrinomonadaceae bacterium]|nr:flippase-like domain-containing protein [Pyrinomonadaceae bacterium]